MGREIREAFAQLDDVQLTWIVYSIVAESERRVPGLKYHFTRKDSCNCEPSESQETLLKHKDLGKWFGTQL
jgi:hypothetical protein